LGASFRFLAILVNVNVSFTIESQVSKTNSCLLNCMIARHDDGFLLLHDLSDERGGTTSATGGFQCSGSVA
jgi:hypothetical protein